MCYLTDAGTRSAFKIGNFLNKEIERERNLPIFTDNMWFSFLIIRADNSSDHDFIREFSDYITYRYNHTFINQEGITIFRLLYPEDTIKVHGPYDLDKPYYVDTFKCHGLAPYPTLFVYRPDYKAGRELALIPFWDRDDTISKFNSVGIHRDWMDHG